MSTVEIIKVVANLYGVSPAEVTSKTQLNRVLFPRYAAITIDRKTNKAKSLSTIANEYGLKTHAAVINAISKYQDLIDTRPGDRALFLQAEKLLTQNEVELAQLTENIPFIYNL